MLSKYVMPGDRIEIIPLHAKMHEDGIGEQKKTYKSQVYDLRSEERLEVTMPMEQAKLILLPIGMEYTIYFYTANGMYKCNARVAERYKTGNIFILGMDLTTELSKFQRREFYRFECAIALEFRELEEAEKEALANQATYYSLDLALKQGVIVDISGGGMRFVSREKMAVNSLLYTKFTMPVNGEMITYHLSGRVLSVREMENKPGAYEARLQYLNIEQKEREDIIKFIFEEERKQRKRKKG